MESNRKYKIGDKVIPFQKTVGIYGNLSDSIVWKTAKDNDQQFLYITRIEILEERDDVYFYVLDSEKDSKTGDYFNEEDFVPFSENKSQSLKYHLDKIKELGYFVVKSEYENHVSVLITSPLEFDLDSTENVPNYGDLMELDEFIDMCDCGSLIDYDGCGDIVYNNKVIYHGIYPSDVEVYQKQLEDLQKELGKIQIMWYNK
jgi:hypothetical protein